MALDHYVAQTYLKHFGDPNKGGMLNAYRKSVGGHFPCWPKDVCREWDDDLNPTWLPGQPALLGEYRKIFEPHWNGAIDKLHTGSVTGDDKLAVSGYLAQLLTCTPTWRRVTGKMADDRAKAEFIHAKEMHLKHGTGGDFPVDGAEALERGEIEIEHDPDWIKALITKQLMNYAWAFFHQDWVLIRNKTDIPFVTSDNPVTSLTLPERGAPAVRLLPISPSLCLQFQATTKRLPPFDFRFAPLGRIDSAVAAQTNVKMINRLQARGAEEFVFSPVQSPGIAKVVENAAPYRVEAEFTTLPSDEPDAFYQYSQARIRRSNT